MYRHNRRVTGKWPWRKKVWRSVKSERYLVTSIKRILLGLPLCFTCTVQNCPCKLIGSDLLPTPHRHWILEVWQIRTQDLFPDALHGQRAQRHYSYGAVTPDSIGDVVLKHGDVSPVAQFVWTYVNTTVAQPGRDPPTGTNSLNLFCLATDAKISLVKMDHMVSYLYLLRGTGWMAHLFNLFTHDFINLTDLCVVSNIWEMC